MPIDGADAGPGGRARAKRTRAHHGGVDSTHRRSSHVRDLRVVVADGGSHDGTPAAVRELSGRWPAIHLIDNPARIQSAAVNLAVRRFGADADILIRCDAHAVYPAAFCQRLVQTLDREGGRRRRPDGFHRRDLSAARGRLGLELAHRHRRRGPSGRAAQRVRRSRPSRRVPAGDIPRGRRLRRDLHAQRGRRAGLPAACPRGAVYLDAEIRVGYRPRRHWPRWRGSTTGTAAAARGQLAATEARCACGSWPCRLTSSRRSVAVAGALVEGRPAVAGALPHRFGGQVGLRSARHRSACGLWAGPAAAVMHVAWGCGFCVAGSPRVSRAGRWAMAVELAQNRPKEVA